MEKDLIIEGTKATFGIFSKDFKERVHKNSDLLNKQLEHVKNIKNSEEYKSLINRRYHGYSDYDQSLQQLYSLGKLGALYLILRELPLRHFYARSFVIGFVIFYYAGWNWKNVPFIPLTEEDKPLYYFSKWDHDRFANYPLLKDYISSKLHIYTSNPGLLESERWNSNQFEPFYLHHFKHYRYILRNARVVPWDGTFNQPVFPYVSNNNRTAVVHNGLNEIIENKANTRW